jgi:hypothetical protein
MWPKEAAEAASTNSKKPELFYDMVQGLTANDAAHAAIKSEALSIAVALGSTRWLMFEQRDNSISAPLLIVSGFLVNDYFH